MNFGINQFLPSPKRPDPVRPTKGRNNIRAYYWNTTN